MIVISMFIKKIDEQKYNNNDLYIIKTCKNNIIINKNYNNALLLDSSLNAIQQIPLSENTIIYHIYKKNDESNIILYSPDDNHITFVDMHTMNTSTISLPNELKNCILSSNYYWQDDILIFTTCGNVFYQFSFESSRFTMINHETIKTIYPLFFKFWNTCKKYNILTMYPDQQSFIFQKNIETITFFDYKQNRIVTTKNYTNGWHDVEYKNNMFIFIHENKIELVANNHKTILQPQENYIFLRAKFINKNSFILLSSKPSNHRESLLETYEWSHHYI